MKEEVIFAGPGFRIFKTDEANTLVPYGSALRPNGNMNYGWLDLRDRPELVATIPETQKSPGLTSLVRELNVVGSPLLTIGCECAEFANDGTEEGPSVQVGGFVDVAFREADLNVGTDQLYAVAGAILSGIGAPPSGLHVYFDMGINRLKLFFGRTDCCYLMIKPIGYGATSEGAWKSFNWAAQAAADSVRSRNETRAGKMRDT